jgi:hypothetical protein
VKLVEGVVEACVETTLGMLLEEIEKVVEVDGSGGVGDGEEMIISGS